MDIPRIMKAVALDHFGGLETLVVRDRPVPEVGPNEILIRVEAAGVGVWDPYEREGGFAEMADVQPKFPYVLGSEGAGTVAAVGERVSRFKAGDRVYALGLMNPKGGFYAQYAAVDADQASPVPAGLTTEQAGAMPVDAMTALRGLDDVLGIRAGETVIVFGASGGVGHMAVQLARRMGARVLAGASGPDGVELVRQLGADSAIDGRRDDVVEAARAFVPDSPGIDAALLTAGGEAAERALATVRDGGRGAFPNGVEPEPRARSGVTLHSYDGTADRKGIDRLNQLIESGPFEVHVARVFRLDQVADAHRALSDHFLGKLVLRPG